MIRKATAKRSEANAAVRRRSTGLDQRFKMSASVAGFPSINAATACLSLFVRSRRRCAHSVLRLLQTPCSTPYTSIEGLIVPALGRNYTAGFDRERYGSLGLFTLSLSTSKWIRS